MMDRLVREGFSPAVLLRGYSASRCGSDEARLYAQRFGERSVYVGADRRASLEKAAADGHRVALLDDAFQHRRVARDLDIVVVDVTRADEQRLLPAGMLREPWSSLKRADAVVLTRVEQVERPVLEELRGRLSQFGPGLRVFTSFMAADGLRRLDTGTLTDLLPRRVFAVCAIGHPVNFLTTVRKAHEVMGYRFFPDHYAYTLKDMERIEAQARSCGAEAILMTEKDACKWAPGTQGLPTYALRAKLGVDSALLAWLLEHLRG